MSVLGGICVSSGNANETEFRQLEAEVENLDGESRGRLGGGLPPPSPSKMTGNLPRGDGIQLSRTVWVPCRTGTGLIFEKIKKIRSEQRQ